MLILVGPSASGKTEIANILINKYKMKRVVTYTTRQIRENEIPGVSYNFVSIDEFLEMKNNNEFIETTFYNNNYYGTRRKDVAFEKIVILDPNGLISFQSKIMDEIYSVYIDSGDETRRKRMIFRGDSKENTEKRIINDQKIFNKNSINVDLVVNNENITIEEISKKIYETYFNFVNNRRQKNE